MNIINKKTYSDLVVIFQMMSSEMLEKINSQFINVVIKKASKEYKSDINPCIPLKEQKLSKQTEAFLALIYNNYFDDSKNNVNKEIKLEENICCPKDDNIQILEKEKTNNMVKMDVLDIKKENVILKMFRKLLKLVKNWFVR